MENIDKTKEQLINGLEALRWRVTELEKLEAERKRVEEALRQSEEKYSTLVERGNDGIIIVQDGVLTFVNSKMIEMTGFSLEEALGKSFVDFVSPEYRELVVDRYRKRISGEEIPSKYEVEILGRDGREISVEISASMIEHDGRAADMAIVRDITERKQVEEKMRESEEKYRQLFELGSDALFLVEVKTGKILDLNNAAIEMYGYSREEALQMKNTDFSAEPDKTRKATLESEKHIPVRYHRRKDGTIFPTDISVAYYTWYGKEVCVAAIRDTTERKKAVDDLTQAAEEWRTTFDSITDLVSIRDKDFRLTRVNKAFADTFNMKPKELIGKLCYEIVHGTNEPVPHCPHKATIETKEPASAELFEPHLGIHLEVTTSPIFNEKGEVVASVHVARDITERKRTEEQLIVTDRLASIGELASGIAHELNNPLTSIIGFSQLLLDKDISDDVKNDLKIIYSEARRTAEVVKSLLIFARKHAPLKQLVNINSIIEKVLELRAYEQKVNNVQVNTRFAPDLPAIMADYFQLQQVFLNIVINAEHFMLEAHHRGTLTITTERVGETIKASFTDDGPGISKKTLGHVFDPFFTTKEIGKGTGLGLSICHGIITEHGGRLYAESALGKGATFIVELPISDH